MIPIAIVEDENEAVRRANASRFGLTASVWTKAARGARIAKRLRAGVVTINNHAFTGALPAAPWSGYGESGYGITGSTLALDALTRPRFVLVDRNRAAREMWWYPYTPALKAVLLAMAVLRSGTSGLGAKLRADPSSARRDAEALLADLISSGQLRLLLRGLAVLHARLVRLAALLQRRQLAHGALRRDRHAPCSGCPRPALRAPSRSAPGARSPARTRPSGRVRPRIPGGSGSALRGARSPRRGAPPPLRPIGAMSLPCLHVRRARPTPGYGGRLRRGWPLAEAHPASMKPRSATATSLHGVLPGDRVPGPCELSLARSHPDIIGPGPHPYFVNYFGASRQSDPAPAYRTTATASISTLERGRPATCTVARAGGAAWK